MAFRTSKFIYYHIPKTGGTWAKNAMLKAGIVYVRAKYYYGTSLNHPEKLITAHKLGLKREHETPVGVLDEDRHKLFSFTFVRSPLAWYKSFWAHRKIAPRLGATHRFALDWLMDENFEKFMINVLEKYPEGFLTKVYQLYLGERGDDLGYVGRQENLREDLITALNLAGEKFNKMIIRSEKKRNVFAGNDFFKNSDLLKISDELVKYLEEKEGWIMDTFYSI